jgi:hypothetical protein
VSKAETKPATSKKAGSGSNAVAVLGTALVAVLVVLVNYISFRRY